MCATGRDAALVVLSCWGFSVGCASEQIHSDFRFQGKGSRLQPTAVCH